MVTFYYESTAISEESNLYSIPTDAVAYGGHHYFIFSDKKCTWEEAFSQCQAMGGYLAVGTDGEIKNYGTRTAFSSFAMDCHWLTSGWSFSMARLKKSAFSSKGK